VEWKIQGIKAGWPRFGTKRGAQPVNPTAVGRDAIALRNCHNEMQQIVKITSYQGKY
jgi:hypothetical protein